jgi:dihydroorotase
MGDGQIREEVLEARRRGVIFEIGHGSGSFGFSAAMFTRSASTGRLSTN